MKNVIIVKLVVMLILLTACQQDPISPKYEQKFLQLESSKAVKLANKIRQETNVEIAEGFELSLWASDSLVHDPIAISIDNQGRIYYTSATRQHNSEFDIRGHQDWMTASISFQTVEDRRAFLKKTFEADSKQSQSYLKDLNGDEVRDWKDLAFEKEQVWIVSDESGDGVADQAHRYLEDFNEEITDVANGIEYIFGEVYIGVGPDLWRTKDTDGDDIADETQSISHGYAVHIGFSGHGMSGVTVGPQGRIWWGIGDIGMNVVDKDGKRWKYPNRGVVVRSEPDGSNFEVFAMGVRNTHEFVFDKYGNLITEDNDADHRGERERLVYLIDGSDTGWRINWQFGKYTDPDNNSYKVWMDEQMHIPPWDGQAAYFLPCIQNYVNGPTGMVYNPGTALSPEWYDHFFIAEFRGSPSNSPIHAFTMKSDGAGFELDKTQEIAKGLLPTGLDFGPDGALYFGDWINGWAPQKDGRIWKLDIPSDVNSTIRKETQQLIEADFATKPLTELESLLAHQDMRIRQKAQFTLVKKGDKGFTILEKTAQSASNQLARIHALWGIAQAARKNKNMGSSLVPFLKDPDEEIIAQAAKLIGDIRYNKSNEVLHTLVNHSNPRIQFFATEALGRNKDEQAIPLILKMLEKNNDQDMWLRMGGMIALGRIGKATPLAALKTHPSKALRTAAVVALRRMESPLISEFIADEEEYVAAEAARGINDDYSIEPALPALAKALQNTNYRGEPFLRRAINANLRVGKKENATILLDYATSSNAPIPMRAEAIEALNTWGKLSVFDRVDGRYRGPKSNDLKSVKPLVLSKIEQLLDDKKIPIKVAAIKTVGKFKIDEKASALMTFLQKNRSEKVREAALMAMHTMSMTGLENALDIALKDKNELVRSKALELLPSSKISGTALVSLYQNVIDNGTIKEMQAVLAAIGTIDVPEVDTLLVNLITQMPSGKINPAIHLDILDAADEKNNEAVNQLVETYHQNKKAQNELTRFVETLEGGDADKGRSTFLYNSTAQCTRCHAVFERGGNAGPNLEGVGSRLSPEQLLASIVTPSSEYAAGYEVVSIELKSEETVAGILVEKTEAIHKIKMGKSDIRTINNEAIKSIETFPSSMLPYGEILEKKEIRNVIAYLKNLK